MTTEYTFRQFHVRGNMMAAIRRYIEERLQPGDFLTAVIDNDGGGAGGRREHGEFARVRRLLLQRGAEFLLGFACQASSMALQ